MSEQINLDIERYVIDYIQPKIQTILTQLSILCITNYQAMLYFVQFVVVKRSH